MKNIREFYKLHLAQRCQTIALLAGVMALGCGSAFAQSTGNATINVTGTITGATCTLSTSNVTIPLGTVDKSTFTGVGSFSPWVNGSLVSGGCDASLVSMTFTAPANSTNPHLFAVTGGAAGVGIELFQLNGFIAIPNSSTPVPFTPQAAGGLYTFSARYVQSDLNITTGPADATITVLITYT
ncbi:fimbrial protein [Dyella psychrodurans]|uniref:Type 1 fimbrial protein n=1 Tax=Dyella psychrodurans TaxID=1927960 RepID=A0A370X725_9GAMM|nr:fimbrial protein [Dyella psychrodurans]RDS84178.1 type 1 fimbrial protein [Dyella psychrodurans]